jgi:hypothetical protein
MALNDLHVMAKPIGPICNLDCVEHGAISHEYIPLPLGYNL